MEELSAFVLTQINGGLKMKYLVGIPEDIYKEQEDYFYQLYALTCKTYTEEDSINQLKG